MAEVGVITFFACLTIIQAAPPKLSGERQVDFTGFADHFRSLKCNIEGGTTYEWFHNGIVGKFFKTDKVVEEAAVTVGKNLTLTCPPRTLSRNVFYHWGGRQGVRGAWFLPLAKHYMIMDDGTLLFANVRKQDLQYFNVVKNGVSCSIESKGKNKRLAFSQRFLLREVGERSVKPFGPTIKTELEDREVAKGTKFVIFRCGAIGLPTPDYSWAFTARLNGTETPITGGQDGYELQNFNHMLIITSVGAKHDGWYKCKVSSNYGGEKHSDEKTARLSVKGLQ